MLPPNVFKELTDLTWLVNCYVRRNVKRRRTIKKNHQNFDQKMNKPKSSKRPKMSLSSNNMGLILMPKLNSEPQKTINLNSKSKHVH